MNGIIKKDFFNRDTIDVAKDLLGLSLARNINGSKKSYVINEVEAYVGPNDKASHAHKGKTDRTEPMFGPPGYFYIYLIYGMYWMLNIVTEEKGHPSAILIRGAGKFDGPGKLTRDLNIDDSFNKKPVSKKSGLWIEDRGQIDKNKYNIISTPRVGVEYADEWANKPYRFVLKCKDNPKGRKD